MGIDTIGYTVTSDKNVFETLTAVKDALRNSGAFVSRVNAFPESHYIVIDFTFGKEGRNMFVFFRSDSDYPPEGEGKIIYSLGYWGSSVELIKAVCLALSHKGPTYMCEADINEQWVEVTAPTPTQEA